MQNLVDDIYLLLDKLEQGESVTIPDELYDAFGKACAEGLKRQMQPRLPRSKGSVRMSNFGQPDRVLYYEVNHPDKAESIAPNNKIRFILGDMLEALCIFLLNASGHEVTEQQGKVSITVGDTTIKGSKDGVVDGTEFDIKSASTYAFNNKFKEGGLESNDPFGYRFQLAGYRTATTSQGEPRKDDTTTSPFFFVIDKQHGHLKVIAPKLPDDEEVKARLEHVLLTVDSPTEPSRCHSTVPRGAKGNHVLSNDCSYCRFKQHCFRDANGGHGLRGFKYKTYKGEEVIWFTDIKDTPRVEEVEYE